MEENMEEGQTQKGCFECCIKCLGGIPYASLIATILLYAGVALFCGCGHEALSGTVNILQTYFEMARTAGDTLDVFTMIDIFKYVIYGIAAAFFVYGILLMVEGFFTTGAIKDLYGIQINHLRQMRERLVYHADIPFHVGLAGGHGFHLPASLHVLQPVDHLPKHHLSGGSQSLLRPSSVWDCDNWRGKENLHRL